MRQETNMPNEALSGQTPVKKWPLGLPVLRAIQEDPLGAAQRLQAEYGDVAALKVLGTRIYYFFRPEAAREILVDHHEDFIKEQRSLEIFRSVQGMNVITTEGPTWDRQRRILTPAFAPKRVAEYTALMAAAADDGIENGLPVRSGQSEAIDVDRFITRITMDVILRALFTYHGTREEADAASVAVRSLTRQNMREVFWPFMPPAWMPYPGRSAKMRHLAVIRGLILSQIQARRSGPAQISTRSDVLGMMMAARDEHSDPSDARLSDDEIHDNCVALFGAGHDTSASALTWWVGLMAGHPQIAARVRQEAKISLAKETTTLDTVANLPLLNASLKEAMRLYPPSTAVFSRCALRDVRIGDTGVPKGSVVILPIWCMHHDKRWFPQPEKFQPERFMPGAPSIPRSAYMPFGAGPHFCLGQQFAMVEMALIAAKLVKFYDFSLENGAPLPHPVVDLVLKPKTRLHVRFTRL
jgi:cytochrome P450